MRGGICARINAYWVHFTCSTHLTNKDDLFDSTRTYRQLQSEQDFDWRYGWTETPPDIDITLDEIKVGDLNAVPLSTDMTHWGFPYNEADALYHRGTHDDGRKIDYIWSSHTGGFVFTEVSQDLIQSDHRYYSTTLNVL